MDGMGLKTKYPIYLKAMKKDFIKPICRWSKYILYGLSLQLLLLHFGFSANAMGQLNNTFETISKEVAVRITGAVTDETGMPMPGVTVSVSGTTVGTATDLEGKYALEVSEGSTLVFSFIGYVTQSVVVGDRSVVDVVLIEDLTSLDEVVVVGYGSQRRSEVTGSVGVVSGEELRARPSFNAMQRLR